MELNLRNPIDFIIFAVILVVVIALIFGAVSLFDGIGSTSKRWQNNFRVYSNYNSFTEYSFTIDRAIENEKAIDKPLQVETIVLRIQPEKGFAFNYTWDVSDLVRPLKIGESVTISLPIEDFLKEKHEGVDGVTVKKVTYKVVD